MIKKIVFVALVIFLSLEVFPQENNLTIEEIVFFGNKRTKESLIKKAVTFEKGEKLTVGAIQESKQRLLDLEIFSHVEIEVKKGEKGIILMVIVKEKSFLYFSPVIALGDEKYNAYWGAEVGLVNFAGINQELFLTGTLGGLDKIGLTYQNNFLIDFFWGIDLETLKYENKYFDFKEEKLSGRFFLGHRISRFSTLLWTKIERTKIKDVPHLNEPEKLLKVGAEVIYDSKNWHVFPSKGIFTQVGAYKALNEKRKTVYDRYISKFSLFMNFRKREVLALDFNATISEGYVPLYDQLFLGGYQTLRGLPRGELMGSNIIVFSCEYRIPITRFSNKPASASSSGSVVYLFTDIGSITEDRRDFKLKDFQLNSGVGFFWILSEKGGLRLDLSMHPKFRLTVASEWKF